MGVRARRWREVAGSTIAALRKRPRAVFLGACLVVLAGSWWGTMFFADRLVSALPDRSGSLSPLPMTSQEIEDQVRRAQEINDQLRAQRAAARAYSQNNASDLNGDSALAEPGAIVIGEATAGGRSGEGAARGGRPAPTEYVATDTPAQPLYTVPATYPEVARQMGASGTVVVQALVGTDGRVASTRVLKSIPALDAAAEDAVRRWRFKPAQSEGVPVETWVSVPIQFRK